MLCIQDAKFSAVSFWDVQLGYNIAVILISFPPALPTQPRDKHRLTNTPMGIPDLACFVFGIILWERLQRVGRQKGKGWEEGKREGKKREEREEMGEGRVVLETKLSLEVWSAKIMNLYILHIRV